MSKNYFFLTNQMNETETGIVTSIIGHIEKGEKKISIAQIAAENYVSAAFIIKMSKKLGFDGYTDMVYNLARNGQAKQMDSAYDLKSLVDNYDERLVRRFVGYLREYRDRKFFVIGAGFADITAEYIAQRLSVCGFMVFNRVHFYDYMVFHDNNASSLQNNIEAAVIIAISQTGETDMVLNDVRRARQNGFKVVAFTKMERSTLAQLADLCRVLDSARQPLIAAVPNPFFGKIILTVEEIMARYFRGGAEPEPARAGETVAEVKNKDTPAGG